MPTTTRQTNAKPPTLCESRSTESPRICPDPHTGRATKGVGGIVPSGWKDVAELTGNDELKGVVMPVGKFSEDKRKNLWYNEVRSLPVSCLLGSPLTKRLFFFSISCTIPSKFDFVTCCVFLLNDRVPILDCYLTSLSVCCTRIENSNYFLLPIVSLTTRRWQGLDHEPMFPQTRVYEASVNGARVRKTR